MGLVNTHFFVGTRCRLSRHKDAKFVHGWVQYFRGESIVVTAEQHWASEPGDTFYIEAFGPKVKACMEATLRTVDAEPTFTESAEEQSSPLSKLTLQLQGHLQVVDNNEASRTLVEGMGATLVCQGVESKCQVRDVSIKGIGLLSDHELPKGAELALTVQTDVGTVSAKGVVRHVRAYRGKFRVGVELTTFSRLDASRWKKLIGEAA